MKLSVYVVFVYFQRIISCQTLQLFPQYASVPFKVTVAKRLAQCLNPELPAGVHQKKLEVYDLIFTKINTKQLGFDIVLYGAGLFPAFQFSTLSVKVRIYTSELLFFFQFCFDCFIYLDSAFLCLLIMHFFSQRFFCYINRI